MTFNFRRSELLVPDRRISISRHPASQFGASVIAFVFTIAILPRAAVAIEPVVADVRLLHFPSNLSLGVVEGREHADYGKVRVNTSGQQITKTTSQFVMLSLQDLQKPQ